MRWTVPAWANGLYKMKAGTAKKRQFIPVHDIVEHLQIDFEVLKLLPGKQVKLAWTCHRRSCRAETIFTIKTFFKVIGICRKTRLCGLEPGLEWQLGHVTIGLATPNSTTRLLADLNKKHNWLYTDVYHLRNLRSMIWLICYVRSE